MILIMFNNMEGNGITLKLFLYDVRTFHDVIGLKLLEFPACFMSFVRF